MIWPWTAGATVVLALTANLLLAPQQPQWAILFGLFLIGALLLSPQRNLGLLLARAPRIWWLAIVVYVVLVAATKSGDLADRVRTVSTAGAQALFVRALAYRMFSRLLGKDDRDKR
jgi:hypothetical protein